MPGVPLTPCCDRARMLVGSWHCPRHGMAAVARPPRPRSVRRAPTRADEATEALAGLVRILTALGARPAPRAVERTSEAQLEDLYRALRTIRAHVS